MESHRLDYERATIAAVRSGSLTPVRSRPFLTLYFAVFVATMGISMVSPLLPVYAEELGAQGIWIGLTFSIFAVTQTIVSPFAGGWSDRYGRKPFIVLGLLIYLAAAIGYVSADTFLQVLAFRALSGGGTSLIFSVARAYIGDLVPEGEEGRWFGFFATADIVGFGIGPLLAGVLRETWGFDSVFVGMGLLMAASATIVALLLPPHREADRQGGRQATGLASFGALRDRLVLALTLIMMLVSLTFGSTFSFLAVRLEGIGLGPVIIGVAFAMESVASGISQPFFGRLADRADRRVLVAGGLVFSSVMLAGLGFAEAVPVLLLLLFGMGLGTGVTMVSTGAMQVVAGRRAGMGAVIGLGAAGNGIGVVFGSVAGGALVEVAGISAPFVFGGVVMLLGMVLVVWLTRGLPTTEAELARLERSATEAAGG